MMRDYDTCPYCGGKGCSRCSQAAVDETRVEARRQLGMRYLNERSIGAIELPQNTEDLAILIGDAIMTGVTYRATERAPRVASGRRFTMLELNELAEKT
jgi:hypothetical protein